MARELSKRASKFDLNMQLNSLRQDDAAGPALSHAIKFPVTMQRQAVGEAHDAMSRTISKWAKGERASIPKRRSVNDDQSITLSSFSIKEKGNKLLVEIKGIGVCKFKPSRLVEIDKIISVVLTRTPSGKNTMSVVTRQEDIEHGPVLLAAGQLIHGRALKRFHASSDPDGEIAEGMRLRQEQRDKETTKKERRVASGRKRLGKRTKGVVALQHHKEMS